MAVALVEASLARPQVRTVPDGRPPGSSWSSSTRPSATQPTLTFDPLSGDALVEPGDGRNRPHPVGHRVLAVSSPGSAVPTPSLPDPRSWAPALALALAESLSGRRPVGQLSRWVDERVQSTLSRALHARRTASATSVSPSTVPRPTPSPSPARPTQLHSVRLQFPQSEAVEVAAHVVSAGRSSAIAFRLEAWGDRWLCTALDLGPEAS